MTKSSGTILPGSSTCLGPAGRCGEADRSRSAAADFVDDAVRRPRRRRAGREPRTSWKSARCIALIGLGLGVAGCSGLLRSDAPPVQVYSLTAPAAPSAGKPDAADSGPTAPADGSVRVAHPLADPGLGTSQIVLLQPDHRMNVFAASAWAADAPALIESLAVQTLRGSGAWRTVEDAEGPFPANYLLQISIRDFDADYSAGTNAPPTVRVTLDCTLGTEEGRDIVASFVAVGSAAAGANRLSEVVAAFQQATDAAMVSLSRQASAAARARR